MGNVLEKVERSGGLLLHRIALLTVGLALVIFFRSWGVIIYIFFVAMYCHALANTKGVEYWSFGVKSPAGNLYGVLLFIVFALSFIVMIGGSFLNDELKELTTSWDRVSIMDFKPTCSGDTVIYGFNISICDRFYWGVNTASILLPILIALALSDMVKFSQLRVKLGKWSFVAFVIVGCLVASPLISPLTFSGTSYYGFTSRIFLFYFSLFFPLLLTRFTF